MIPRKCMAEIGIHKDGHWQISTITGYCHGFFSEGNEDGTDILALVEKEDGTVIKAYKGIKFCTPLTEDTVKGFYDGKRKESA